MVADRNDNQVTGYMIYELHRNRIHLLTIGVLPEARSQGVGRKLIEKLIGKLTQTRRNRITCEVRETNLNAQQFFRHMGFRAISVINDFYDDTEDAYLMQYRIGGR
jgi:ribosomal-protein-alanine N-acetyltransferase